MINNSMREEFEAAFRSAGQFKAMSSGALDSMLERGSDGECRSVRVHGAWWGWQASRESLVIDLGNMTNNGYEGFYPANQIKRALRDAGVKQK